MNKIVNKKIVVIEEVPPRTSVRLTAVIGSVSKMQPPGLVQRDHCVGTAGAMAQTAPATKKHKVVQIKKVFREDYFGT